MIEIDVKKIREWAMRCSGYCLMEIDPQIILDILDSLDSYERNREEMQQYMAAQAEEIAALKHDLERALANHAADARGDVTDDTKADAGRYRFLEYQARTGAYRGIISRKAIDAAIDAALTQWQEEVR
ncbi:hypothetical protein WS62_25990 [Burkholderia sp. ABCPW 14]|uniref:hypothetical protein n=1 Tax=Burkholderia sp. ABCPW 14 TaxID=1637860 RepID=UPI000770D951|nr:hypothetical protein [Burkholderia sp. ABCPW 14]KVD80775.1 hypothetical protein WS62_25990 [Burkholderia sp. ABCPW 14]